MRSEHDHPIARKVCALDVALVGGIGGIAKLVSAWMISVPGYRCPNRISPAVKKYSTTTKGHLEK
jgi:hypothetical protein